MSLQGPDISPVSRPCLQKVLAVGAAKALGVNIYSGAKVTVERYEEQAGLVSKVFDRLGPKIGGANFQFTRAFSELKIDMVAVRGNILAPFSEGELLAIQERMGVLLRGFEEADFESLLEVVMVHGGALPGSSLIAETTLNSGNLLEVEQRIALITLLGFHIFSPERLNQIKTQEDSNLLNSQAKRIVELLSVLTAETGPGTRYPLVSSGLQNCGYLMMRYIYSVAKYNPDLCIHPGWLRPN